MNKISCLLFIFGLLSGCSVIPVPDLTRLYETHPLSNVQTEEANVAQPPVILIHGVFGARLRDRKTEEEVWPGGIMSLLFSDYSNLALPIDKQTLMPASSKFAAFAITDRAAGQDFYGAIIRTLEKSGGYQKGVPGQSVVSKQRQYYVFYYDWRQDNVQTARKLDDLIKTIQQDYAKPEMKVDIVAHSMGGLITRYYLRYGRVDVLDDNEFPVNNYGAKQVRKVILLGTPNLGSVSGLKEFINGFKVGLGRIPTETLATMPSSYQLFPHPIRTTMVTMNGKKLDRDLFDIKIWRDFEFSIFDPDVRQNILDRYDDPVEGNAYLDLLERYFEKHLERGRRFVWSLTVPVEDSIVRYVIFGGDCELTPSRIVIEDVNGESIPRFHPDDIAHPVTDVDYQKLMLEPGDGRVTKPSLFAREALDPSIPRHPYSFFPMDHSIMLCESHDSLTGNVSFQNNLLNMLLTRDEPLDRKTINSK